MSPCWGCREGCPAQLTRCSRPFSLSQRDGNPYCESDYHAQFGIKCETCDRYISGRVLEVSPGAVVVPVCHRDGVCHAQRCMPWGGGGVSSSCTLVMLPSVFCGHGSSCTGVWTQCDHLLWRVGMGQGAPPCRLLESWLGYWSSRSSQSMQGLGCAGTCSQPKMWGQ